MHRKDIGKWGESVVISQILQHGCTAFVDFGDNSKIDLIVVDHHHGLHKVQVKTVTREGGTSTLLLYKNGPGYRFKYEEGMVDWFALVDVETAAVAWVKSTPELLVGRQIALRHTPTKNKQTKKVKWFSDYTNFPFV